MGCSWSYLSFNKEHKVKNVVRKKNLPQICSARAKKTWKIKRQNEAKWKTRQSHGKSKQQKAVRVELRAGKGLQNAEKPGWCTGDMEKHLGDEKPSVRQNNNNHPTPQNPPEGSPEFYWSCKLNTTELINYELSTKLLLF